MDRILTEQTLLKEEKKKKKPDNLACFGSAKIALTSPRLTRLEQRDACPSTQPAMKRPASTKIEIS